MQVGATGAKACALLPGYFPPGGYFPVIFVVSTGIPYIISAATRQTGVETAQEVGTN